MEEKKRRVFCWGKLGAEFAIGCAHYQCKEFWFLFLLLTFLLFHPFIHISQKYNNYNNNHIRKHQLYTKHIKTDTRYKLLKKLFENTWNSQGSHDQHKKFPMTKIISKHSTQGMILKPKNNKSRMYIGFHAFVVLAWSVVVFWQLCFA